MHRGLGLFGFLICITYILHDGINDKLKFALILLFSIYIYIYIYI